VWVVEGGLWVLGERSGFSLAVWDMDVENELPLSLVCSRQG
jgi:hypothetical protein